MRLIITTLVVVFAAAIQSGCGEPSQEAQYQDGRYAGKPDTPAWKGEAFDGKRENWERAIKRRNQLQSEYTRPGGA